MVEFIRGQWKDLTDMVDPFSIMFEAPESSL